MRPPTPLNVVNIFSDGYGLRSPKRLLARKVKCQFWMYVYLTRYLEKKIKMVAISNKLWF